MYGTKRDEGFEVSGRVSRDRTRLLESRGVIRRGQRAVQRIAAEAGRKLPASYAQSKAAMKRMEEMNALLIESIETRPLEKTPPPIRSSPAQRARTAAQAEKDG